MILPRQGGFSPTAKEFQWVNDCNSQKFDRVDAKKSLKNQLYPSWTWAAPASNALKKETGSLLLLGECPRRRLPDTWVPIFGKFGLAALNLKTPLWTSDTSDEKRVSGGTFGWKIGMGPADPEANAGPVAADMLEPPPGPAKKIFWRMKSFGCCGCCFWFRRFHFKLLLNDLRDLGDLRRGSTGSVSAFLTETDFLPPPSPGKFHREKRAIGFFLTGSNFVAFFSATIKISGEQDLKEKPTWPSRLVNSVRRGQDQLGSRNWG